MVRGGVAAAAAATTIPWYLRRKQPGISESSLAAISHHDYGAHEPLLNEPLPSTYGSVSGLSPSSAPHRAERRRSSSRSLSGVPEEPIVEEDAVVGEEEVERALNEKGYFKGSYERKWMLYTLSVPVACLLLFVLLAILPMLAWPWNHSIPSTHVPYFPFPLPALFVSSALWALAHIVRLPLYTGFTNLLRSAPFWATTVLFNLVYAFIYNILRLAALPILNIRHQMDYPYPTWRDFAFRRVWWLALGWGITESVVAIIQDYQHLALYKYVMIPEDRLANLESQARGELGISSAEVEPRLQWNPEEHPGPSGEEGEQSSAESPSGNEAEALEIEVDRDLEQLMNLKERELLEEVYDIPFIKIPVFVLCLQRISSLLITVGFTLILGETYLRSDISISPDRTSSHPSSSNTPFLVSFPLIVLLNTLLMVMYTPLILPDLGVHLAAYIAFFIGLGSLFVGLALWGALA